MDYDQQIQAAMLRQRDASGRSQYQNPEGRMVSGRYVAPNFFEYLSAGLRSAGAGRDAQMANQELTDLQAKKQAAMQGDMNAMITALRGKPAETVQPLTPNDDEGNVNAPIQMPAKAGSMDDFYRVAAGSQFPQFQQMGMQGAITSAQQQAQKAQEDQTRQGYIAALNQYGPAEAVRMGLVPSNIATEFANAKNIGRDEVSKQIEIEGPNGEKLIQNIDKFGQPVGAPTPAYTAPVQVNSGGAVQFVKPTAGKAIPITMSPKDKDESARGWAGVNNARERLAFDKTKPAAGAGGMPTEGERKAATLLQRMQSSEAQLEEALKLDKTAAKPGIISSGLRAVGGETLANAATPESRQKVEAAQLDILDAALTLGTGAAYTKEQLEGYRKSYFPQLGDKPSTIKDKQDRLNNILEAARIAAGRAAGQVTSQPPPSAAKPTSIDALLEKYK
jgi:hypothetical protein